MEHWLVEIKDSFFESFEMTEQYVIYDCPFLNSR